MKREEMIIKIITYAAVRLRGLVQNSILKKKEETVPAFTTSISEPGY